ncbi:transcription-repair coupling factor [Peptoniphilus catoniae]|uniref:transcription-repair coupling factor n=1 Tax=Peptoniphilus catoniae TaxID=1660341 RepID=UPI0010FEBCE7|nr:transcription-repair coupling factor [Peptoniphilus catoniae]
MNFISDPIKDLKAYKEIVSLINIGKSPLGVYGGVSGQKSHMIYSLLSDKIKPIIFIAGDNLKARRTYEDLRALGVKNTGLYLNRDLFLYDRYSKGLDNIKKRVSTLEGIVNKSFSVIITTPEALGDKIISKEIFKDNVLKIKVGDEIDLKNLSQKLVDMGYERLDQVEGFGQFSQRGSIIDIYTSSGPVRIELFDVEVDSLRSFDIAGQRSIENLKDIKVSPATDILIPRSQTEAIADKLEKALKKSEIKNNKDRLREKFRRYIDDLKSQGSVKNTDLIIPFIEDKYLESILDYFNKDALIIFDEPNGAMDKLKSLDEEYKSGLADLMDAGEALKEHEKVRLSPEVVAEKIKKHRTILLSALTASFKNFSPQGLVSLKMRSSTNYKGKMKLFIEDLNRYIYRGYKIVIMAGDDQRAKRLKDTLFDEGITARFEKNYKGQIKSGEIIVTVGALNEGFEIVDLKYLLVNYREIYGGDTRVKKKKNKKSLNFDDLNIGDYVVHEAHGVGKYVGTQRLTLKGVTKDYALIQYKGTDKLFLPIENLDSIYKYTSSEGKAPKISKLNSLEWNRAKSKAKKSVEDMAEDLIKLYATRMESQGFAFSKDSLWQREFEDSFEFEDTPGQVRSSEEIKEDMESNRPMDRLLCADVGYGKTEVAIRAAFKAIMDGKQVAFLVPTTILARQHYNTIVDRFKGYPISTVLLSRFRSKKEQEKDLKDLKAGIADMVVGTHRILSKDVEFKDLGLLIVDEEQRFGVRDKERLKMMRENVDTLTLTATPIPRTLQMSMIGIRDMSVIEEPPEERFPVQTYVVEYNNMMIRDAIIREMERGGQIYFVYNRVANMENKLSELKALVPEARFAMAHGQMPSKILEDTMLSFIDGDFDVLLCSTIIETGMDMKNVNTMIVADSNRLGLSQLYQLRGRIGRSDKIAYAYFTYEPNLSLTEIAQKRLKSIKEFTEFGSGYKIALKDLEIRGSGSILGSRQSGHINSVGYDLYIKYLKEALMKLKGQEVKERPDTSIDLNIDSYIPREYIKNDSSRIEIYKKIASISSKGDYSDLVDELIDRFGEPPKEVINLMDIALLRYQSKEAGILSINQKDFTYEIKLLEFIDLETVKALGKGFKQMELNPGSEPSFKLRNLKNPIEDLNKVAEILKVTQKNHKKR